MKRHALTLLALGATILTAGYVLGQNQAKSAAPSAQTPAGPKQKAVKVATLSTVEANRDFQNNVQLLQAQRQAATELTVALEKEKDAKKKAEIKSQLDAITAKLNENNQTMLKAYGFTLARNYTMEIEVSHIYILVSEEEAADMERAVKAQKEKTGKK